MFGDSKRREACREPDQRGEPKYEERIPAREDDPFEPVRFYDVIRDLHTLDEDLGHEAQHQQR